MRRRGPRRERPAGADAQSPAAPASPAYDPAMARIPPTTFTPRRDASGRPTATIDELRAVPERVLSYVAKHGERVHVKRSGRVVAVLLHPEDLRILDAIEDARDAEIGRRGLEEAARDGTIPHAEVVAGPATRLALPILERNRRRGAQRRSGRKRAVRVRTPLG